AEAAEDSAVTVDVLANDTRGADGASVTKATVSEDLGSVVVNENGTITFTPAAGVEGDVVIDYTLTDADGDTSTARLTVTVAADSTPEIVIPPGEPGDPGTPPEPADPENPEYPGDPEDPSDNIDLAAGDSLRVVDEAGLSDGSDAEATTETTSGTFDIRVGSDDLSSVVINGTPVTEGGTVQGKYGTLTVTESGGEYQWSYTLDSSTTDHASEGPAIDNVRDLFNLE
ncbi:Ig-like domain-containing protein, partial [Halomonas cupida]